MDQHILGFDIGGVIIDRVKNDNTDTSFFSHNYLKTTAVEGMFETIKVLNSRFGGRIHLVSKCGEQVQKKTLHWLTHHDFYKITGVKEANVHFCRERHEKAPICERLAINHFVDDRLEVLSYLKTVRYRYLFQPRAIEISQFADLLSKVIQVNSAPELLQELLAWAD